jgi:subtilisin-like proprotein convertase family protein
VRGLAIELDLQDRFLLDLDVRLVTPSQEIVLFAERGGLLENSNRLNGDTALPNGSTLAEIVEGESLSGNWLIVISDAVPNGNENQGSVTHARLIFDFAATEEVSVRGDLVLEQDRVVRFADGTSQDTAGLLTQHLGTASDLVTGFNERIVDIPVPVGAMMAACQLSTPTVSSGNAFEDVMLFRVGKRTGSYRAMFQTNQPRQTLFTANISWQGESLRLSISDCGECQMNATCHFYR